MQGRHPHEPAELRLSLRRTDDGGFVISTPLTPGWCFPAKTPAQLAHGIEQAYAEVTIAAYARLRGVLYDLAETEEQIPAAAFAAAPQHPAEPLPEPVDEVAEKRRRKHPKTHEPEQWQELEDGRWLSPSGRRYRPDTAIVASIRQARAR